MSFLLLVVAVSLFAAAFLLERRRHLAGALAGLGFGVLGLSMATVAWHGMVGARAPAVLSTFVGAVVLTRTFLLRARR